jgi:hypothetical protein
MGANAKRGVTAAAGMAALAVAAWGAIGQQQPPAPGGRVVETGRVSVPIGTPMPRPPRLAEMPPPPGPCRMARSGPMTVTVEGPMITVAMGAEVYDNIGDHVYVWSLRVYADTPKRPRPLLREHHYERQATWLAPGETAMEPQFLDSFLLPQGAYAIDLRLYDAPPEFKFSRQKFGADFKRLLGGGVSGFKRIQVGE